MCGRRGRFLNGIDDIVFFTVIHFFHTIFSDQHTITSIKLIMSHIVTIFLCVMRTSKVSSVSEFPGYGTV